MYKSFASKKRKLVTSGDIIEPSRDSHSNSKSESTSLLRPNANKRKTTIWSDDVMDASSSEWTKRLTQQSLECAKGANHTVSIAIPSSILRNTHSQEQRSVLVRALNHYFHAHI